MYGSEDPLLPIRFEWRYGGHQVHLCGSFTRWLETVPMAPSSLEPQVAGAPPMVFAVVCNLPPGVHQYKFIVDGEWRHDESQPYMPDPLGNVNNWIFVGAPGAPPTVASAACATALVQPAQVAQMPTHQPTHTPSKPTDEQGMDWSSPQQQPTTPGGSGSGEGHESRVSPAGGVSTGAPALPGAPPVPGDMDPTVTRSRLAEFLRRHTAYELIPESAKVVVLDTALPVQQAFHALYEQGLTSAPLWEAARAEFVGVVSASDFIAILHRLRHRTPALSPAELEQLTLARWRAECQLDQQPLLAIRPEDTLHTVAHTLLRSGYKSVPILSFMPSTYDTADLDPAAAAAQHEVAQLLHMGTLGGVLSAVARHFRHTPTALPLLSQPLGALGVGTFREGVLPPGLKVSKPALAASRKSVDLPPMEPTPAGETLHTLSPSTPLPQAMARLLHMGVAALPVVDNNGMLLDQYARADVVALAKDQAYIRLPLDNLSVAQALTYCSPPAGGAAGATGAAAGAPGLAGGSGGVAAGGPGGVGAGTTTAEGLGRVGRCVTCTRATPLRAVLEALTTPGVQRLVCVEPGTNRAEGIVSLRDVAFYLFSA